MEFAVSFAVSFAAYWKARGTREVSTIFLFAVESKFLVGSDGVQQLWLSAELVTT